mgnify:CR=1 FL=1
MSFGGQSLLSYVEQLPYCVNGREQNGNWHRHQTGNGFPTGNRRWVGRSYRNISSISNGRDVGWDLHTAEQAHKLLSFHGPGARGLPVDARGLGPSMGRILSRVKKRRDRLHQYRRRHAHPQRRLSIVFKPLPYSQPLFGSWF